MVVPTVNIPIDSVQLTKLMGENEPPAFYLGNSEFIPSSDGVQDLSLEHRTVTTAPQISHSPMPDTSSIGNLVQKSLSTSSSYNNVISSDMDVLDDTESRYVQANYASPSPPLLPCRLKKKKKYAPDSNKVIIASLDSPHPEIKKKTKKGQLKKGPLIVAPETAEQQKKATPRKINLNLRCQQKRIPCTFKNQETNELCKIKVISMSHLKVHMRTHTGEKPYQCHICDKAFATLSNCHSHMCIHSMKKPFTCLICDKTYTSESYLKKHLRIHTGDDHHTCKLCGKIFTTKGNFTQHMNLHSRKCAYTCDICNITLMSLHNFNRHNRSLQHKSNIVKLKNSKKITAKFNDTNTQKTTQRKRGLTLPYQKNQTCPSESEPSYPLDSSDSP